MALLLTKWQIKYKRDANDKHSKCHFCKQGNLKWEHYTKCNRMPMEILEDRYSVKNFLEGRGIKQNIDDIMSDVNLLKLQNEMR